MSIVNLSNIKILENPASFSAGLSFEITFECLSSLESDLEFKIIYVGSAEDEKHDQTLDSILVGPVPVGVNKFVFQADAPKAELIPKEDLIGVTVILLTCSYKEKEFVRVGYYVNIDYDDEEMRLNPPETVQINQLMRNILADQPRVTRIPIAWDGEEEMPVESLNAGVLEANEEPEDEAAEEDEDEEMMDGDEEEEEEIDLEKVSEEEMDEEIEEIEQENASANANNNAVLEVTQ